MLFFQPVFLFVFLTESSLHLSARISREDFRPKVGSLLNRQLNADVLSPSAPAPSLIALLLYGWTERLAAVLPTKCGAVAVHAAAGREERHLVLRLDFSAWHCAPQRGCHQLGVRRLSPRRAPSVAVRQPHTSQHSTGTESDPSVFYLDFVQWRRWVRRSMEGRQRQGGGGKTMLLLLVRFIVSMQCKGRTYSTFLDEEMVSSNIFMLTGSFDVILLF